jgi:polyhydroxyalkanoate synthase
MRKGPHPLLVQIALAACSAEASSMEKKKSASGPETEIIRQMKKMLLGIQRYQSHPYKVERPPLEKIWKAGTVSLQAIPENIEAFNKDYKQEILLLIPSMVNRGYILDLMPERSMLRWMSRQGIASLLLDWGEGVEDEGQQSVEGIILQRLVPAIEYIAQKTNRKVNVLGYCMGGTLLAAAAQYTPGSIASLTFLAAPWDFHAGTKNVLNRVKFWSPSAFPAIAEKGFLPGDWMQVLFASLEPQSAANKFSKFMDMQEGDNERLFIAVEDWLNDGVDLPGAVAQQCIREWFFGNAPAAQKWMLHGRPVNPAMLDIPTLVITSRRDRLVDYEAAAAIAAGMQKAKILDTCTGHIGMIAGSDAIKKVWLPIADWIRTHRVA